MNCTDFVTGMARLSSVQRRVITYAVPDTRGGEEVGDNFLKPGFEELLDLKNANEIVIQYLVVAAATVRCESHNF